MRALLVAGAIILASHEAAAKVVSMEPPVARACPTAKSWPALMDCMKRHRLKATVVRQLDDAKLLVVQPDEAKHGEIEGWALYVASGTTWKLGGLAQDGDTLADAEVLRFERIVSGTRHGYRFDVATTQASTISLDQVTIETSILRSTLATFCSGVGYSCITLVASCEQLVFGQAVLAFAGSIAVDNDQIKLTGVGTQPQSCSGPATYTALVQ